MKTARIKTTGPKHALGILILDSTSVSPSGDSGTASVVATTLPPVPPQTKLALTLLTGLGVPRLTRIKPAISTRSRPSPVKAAEPRWTVQGAPPLGTPPITVLRFEPIIVERDRNSSPSAHSGKNFIHFLHTPPLFVSWNIELRILTLRQNLPTFWSEATNGCRIADFDQPACGLTAPSVRQMFNVSRLCCMHPDREGH